MKMDGLVDVDDDFWNNPNLVNFVNSPTNINKDTQNIISSNSSNFSQSSHSSDENLSNIIQQPISYSFSEYKTFNSNNSSFRRKSSVSSLEDWSGSSHSPEVKNQYDPISNGFNEWSHEFQLNEFNQNHQPYLSSQKQPFHLPIGKMKPGQQSSNFLLNSNKYRSKYSENDVIVPSCRSHALPCISFNVQKPGPNQGRKFWTCPLDQRSKCNTFIWDNEISMKDCPTTSSGTVTFSYQVISEKIFTIRYFPPNSLIAEYLRSLNYCQYDRENTLWKCPITKHNDITHSLQTLHFNCPVRIISIPKKLIENLINTKKRTQDVFDTNRLPTNLIDKMYPFQLEGVKYVIEHNGRTLIGDEMGLGKTLQAIAVACYYREEWPVLCIVPSSLRLTWENEFVKWIPHVGSNNINVIMGGKQSLTNVDITIISYDLAFKFASDLLDRKYKIIICDETHYLKNPQAQRSKVILPLIEKAKRAILLTGTPALSRPIEVYTQIKALRSDLFGSQREFGIRYCAGYKGAWGWDFSNHSNLNELNLCLKKYLMIRRLKTQVLTQLPSKQRLTVMFQVKDKEISRIIEKLENISQMVQHVFKKLDRKEKNYQSYQEQDDDELSQIENTFSVTDRNKKALFLKLYTLTGMSKLPNIIAYIKDMLDSQSDQKFLVFAHHQKVLDGIEKFLIEKKIIHIRIDGKINSKKKQAQIHFFQKDKKCLIALLSITAACHGITLTAAHLVVFAELYWTPALLLQAEDRTHRIGQKHAVTIHYLLGRDTLDDYVWPLISKKLSTLGETLNGHRESLNIQESHKIDSNGKFTMDSDTHITHSVKSKKKGGLLSALYSGTPSIKKFFQSQWSCSKCTFKNSPNRTDCEMCNFKRNRNITEKEGHVDNNIKSYDKSYDKSSVFKSNIIEKEGHFNNNKSHDKSRVTEWSCPDCNLKNSYEFKYCQKCIKKRSDSILNSDSMNHKKMKTGQKHLSKSVNSTVNSTVNSNIKRRKRIKNIIDSNSESDSDSEYEVPVPYGTDKKLTENGQKLTKKNNNWTCEKCTLLNPDLHLICSGCFNERQVKYDDDPTLGGFIVEDDTSNCQESDQKNGINEKDVYLSISTSASCSNSDDQKDESDMDFFEDDYENSQNDLPLPVSIDDSVTVKSTPNTGNGYGSQISQNLKPNPNTEISKKHNLNSTDRYIRIGLSKRITNTNPRHSNSNLNFTSTKNIIKRKKLNSDSVNGNNEISDEIEFFSQPNSVE